MIVGMSQRRWEPAVLLGWVLLRHPHQMAVHEPCSNLRARGPVDGAPGVRCGVLAAWVHSRRRQRLRDLPVAGPVGLVWVKGR
jgi:hypothetical protein